MIPHCLLSDSPISSVPFWMANHVLQKPLVKWEQHESLHQDILLPYVRDKRKELKLATGWLTTQHKNKIMKSLQIAFPRNLDPLKVSSYTLLCPKRYQETCNMVKSQLGGIQLSNKLRLCNVQKGEEYFRSVSILYFLCCMPVSCIFHIGVPYYLLLWSWTLKIIQQRT